MPDTIYIPAALLTDLIDGAEQGVKLFQLRSTLAAYAASVVFTDAAKHLSAAVQQARNLLVSAAAATAAVEDPPPPCRPDPQEPTLFDRLALVNEVTGLVVRTTDAGILVDGTDLIDWCAKNVSPSDNVYQRVFKLYQVPCHPGMTPAEYYSMSDTLAGLNAIGAKLIQTIEVPMNKDYLTV